ncbi:hypothetical protein NEFER02_1727 [Nematocida sp. LUAm2]|nr:hypothetical protein NEFER02_1727 [Nematocida sp. LUAm2]
MRKYQEIVFLGLILLFMCFSSLKAADSPRLVIVEEEEEMSVGSLIITNEESLPSGSQENIKLSDAESLHKSSSLLGKRLSSNNISPETTQTYNPLSIIIDGSTSGINPSITSTDMPTCSTNSIPGTNYQSAFTPYSSTSGMPSSSSQPSIQRTDIFNTSSSSSSLPSLLSIPMANIGSSSLQTDVSERHELSSLSTNTVFKKILLLGSKYELDVIRMSQEQAIEVSSYTIFCNMPTQEEFLPILNQHRFVIVYVAVGRANDGLSMLMQIIEKNQNPLLNLIFEWMDFSSLDTIKNSSIMKSFSEYLQEFSFTTYIEPFVMLINTYSNYALDSMQIIKSMPNSLYTDYSNKWYKAIYVLRSRIPEEIRSSERYFSCPLFNLLIYPNIEEVGVFSIDSESYITLYLLMIPFLSSNMTHIKRTIILEPNVGCYNLLKNQIDYCPKYIDVTYNHWRPIYKYLRCSSQGKFMQEIIIRNIFLYQLLGQTPKAKTQFTPSEEHASTSAPSTSFVASDISRKVNYKFIYVKKLFLHLNSHTRLNMSRKIKEFNIFDSILDWLTKKEICCTEVEIEVSSKLWTKEKEILAQRIQSGNTGVFSITNFNSFFVPAKFSIVNAENKKRIVMQIKKPLLTFMPNGDPNVLSIAPIQISIWVSE